MGKARLGQSALYSFHTQTSFIFNHLGLLAYSPEWACGCNALREVRSVWTADFTRRLQATQRGFRLSTSWPTTWPTPAPTVSRRNTPSIALFPSGSSPFPPALSI